MYLLQLQRREKDVRAPRCSRRGWERQKFFFLDVAADVPIHLWHLLVTIHVVCNVCKHRQPRAIIYLVSCVSSLSCVFFGVFFINRFFCHVSLNVAAIINLFIMRVIRYDVVIDVCRQLRLDCIVGRYVGRICFFDITVQ